MKNLWTKDGGIYCGLEVLDPYVDQTKCALKTPWKTASCVFNYTGEGHMIIIGPNGSGKTRYMLVPNLCALPNWSILVVDPKGELAVWTAKHRKDNGSEIVTFDPYGVIDRLHPGLTEELPYLKSRRFNPIAMLDPTSDYFTDDANAIGEALINKVDGENPHWGESAQDLVNGLVMALRIRDPENSLADLRDVIGLEAKDLGLYLKDIISDTNSEPAIATKLNRFAVINPDCRELISILSNALTQTRWLDSKPIRRDLSGEAYDFAGMKRRPVTVFLILPPSQLIAQATWLRLMISAVLTPLMRSTTQAHDVPALLMLDEFAALGRLEVIERTMPVMRGYGIKLCMVLQDLSQLKSCYHIGSESFIANAGVTLSFAPNDMTTRKYLAEMSGKREYWVWTNSMTKSFTNNSNWVNQPPNLSYQDSRTYYHDYVYPEHELALMQRGQAVVFEYQRPPRRILLPDPSQLNAGKVLMQAEAFAEQCKVNDEARSEKNKIDIDVNGADCVDKQPSVSGSEKDLTNNAGATSSGTDNTDTGNRSSPPPMSEHHPSQLFLFDQPPL